MYIDDKFINRLDGIFHIVFSKTNPPVQFIGLGQCSQMPSYRLNSSISEYKFLFIFKSWVQNSLIGEKKIK